VLTHNSHNTFVHASSRLVSLLTWQLDLRIPYP